MEQMSPEPPERDADASVGCDGAGVGRVGCCEEPPEPDAAVACIQHTSVLAPKMQLPLSKTGRVSTQHETPGWHSTLGPTVQATAPAVLAVVEIRERIAVLTLVRAKSW
eukprot:894054-Prymnesium_polylepis.1